MNGKPNEKQKKKELKAKRQPGWKDVALVIYHAHAMHSVDVLILDLFS